nr:MAG TPA: 60S ribosomal protein L8 [Caudoviricetes sp.]
MSSQNKQNYLLTPQSLFACDKFSLAEKVVLARAMSFGNHRYYESAEKTASFLGISESVVEKARAKFIKLGYFKKVGYSNNRAVYEVCDDIIEKDCQVRRITKNDFSFCPEQSQNMQPTIAECAISQKDTYIYNNKEDNKDITPLTPLRGAVAVQKDKKDEKDEVDNIFNLWLSCFGLSERKLTPGRVVKIKRRLKDCGKKQLELAIRNASRDYFYRGDNDRGWQADIDYICRSVEIVERLANMTPRAEKKLSWWEQKQKEEDEEREERIKHPKYDEFGREARSDEAGNLVYV